MDYVKKEIELPKETCELADGIAKLVVAIKEAMADGWDTTQDVPALITTALAVLPGAIDGFDKIDDELKADKAAFAMAFAFAAKDIFAAFEKKDA